MAEFAGILGTELTEESNEMLRMLKVMTLPRECNYHQRFFPKAVFGKSDDAFFFDPRSSYCLAYHGEMYNWNELYTELINTGQTIDNRSPASLLLTAYQTWGPKFLSKLNGRFVLFIYDTKEKRLLIARDKLGAYRIYWGKYSKFFLFATSLKGLLTSNYVPQNPCMESLAAYLYLGYFPQDKTPIVNLNCLLPGYYLIVDGDLNIILNKYWSFKEPVLENQLSTQEEVNKRFDELFSQAILRRCKSQYPLSCSYQGDLGSAALAHYFNKLGIKDVTHYTNDFSNQPSSHLPFVDHLSEKFQFSLNKQIIGPERLFDNLQRIVWHLDEPIADPNSILIWDLASKMSGRTKGFFCSLGYNEFLGSHYDSNTLSYEPLFLWFFQLLRPLVTRFGLPLVAKMNKKFVFKALRYYQKDFWASDYIGQNALFNKSQLKKIAPGLYLEFDFDIYIHQTYQYLKYIHYQNFDISDYFFYDAETTLSNHLLVQYGNIMRGFDIDLLCPFLDLDLSLFLIHTPEKFKSNRKCSALPFHDKLKGHLDPQFLHYEYQQSPTFLNNWLQIPNVRQLFERLEKGSLCESGIISIKGLKEELNHASFGNGQFHRLWSILVLEIWFQLFINRPQYKYPEAGIFEDLPQLL